MLHKRLQTNLLLAFAVFFLFGAGGAPGQTEEDLSFPDGLEKGFSWRWPPPRLGFSLAIRDQQLSAGGETWAMSEDSALEPAKTISAGERKKRPGRAILILSGFILAETIRYWVESKKWREDWNYRFTWDDQKTRFFSLAANRFDSNPFVTNWTHLISGHLYYSMGRYYNLSQFESVLLSMGSSLWWEYVTEWREVISINDNLFSGLGGIALGEPLFQFATYFCRRPGILNKAIGFVFNPVFALNDVLAGKRGKSRWRGLESAKPRLQLTIGHQRRNGLDEAPAVSPLLQVGLDAAYLTIPGFGDPEQHDRGGWIKKTILSEISLDMAVGAGRVQEFSFFSRAVLGGFFRQELRPGPRSGVRGYNYFLGLATSFDLFKKAATAYYDQGEYHYDFAAGEQAPQPTDFVDKCAAVNLIGPVFDARFYAGPARFRLALAGSLDFALVNALALNPYSREHDIFEPRMKTTLVHYGYYYAFGTTLSAAAGMQFGNFGFSSRCKYQVYGSIEGLDRFQDRVVDDGHIRDSRLACRFELRYSLPGMPVALGLAFEEIRRWGSLAEVKCRRAEQRLTSQLVISF